LILTSKYRVEKNRINQIYLYEILSLPILLTSFILSPSESSA
jgi:hypothetical protein